MTGPFRDLSSGEIDVLCDPSTIDQERLTLPNVMVSQPIYMSGIGVAAAKRFDEWVAHWPCIGPIVGVVEGTTTRSDVTGKLAKDRRFGVSFGEKVMQHPNVDHDSLTAIEADQFTRCAAKAKQDNIDASRLATTERPSPVLKSFVNHSSLARAVCEQRVMFSVGDLEIIAQALKAAQADSPDCSFEIDPVVISEERYGIFANVSPQMDARDKLAVESLRQLSVEIHKGHESILIRSFRNNFDAANVSRTLNIFFWNVIAGSN